MKTHKDTALQYVEVVPSGEPIGGLPLVIVLHGRGADSQDLADLAPALAGRAHFRFVFANAPHPFEPMPGYRIGYSWFHGWPAEPESFRESRRLLMEFVSQMFERYETAAEKTVISGFSQGGMMALDIGYRLEQSPAGIVVMSGAINEYELPPLAEHPNLPVLLVHGTADDMIPVLAARRTRRILEQQGINPEYHEFPIGHWVSEEELRIVADFIHRCLARPPATTGRGGEGERG